jgi:hypothetical protein
MKSPTTHLKRKGFLMLNKKGIDLTELLIVLAILCIIELLGIFIFTQNANSSEFENYIAAWTFDRDHAHVVIWQTKSGNFKACGPVQRLSTSYKDVNTALDYVTSDKDWNWIANTQPQPEFIDGTYRYAIIDLGRPLLKGEYDALRCVE